MKFCIDCGEPSEQTRCDEHRKERRNQKNKGRKTESRGRGYNARWDRLSRRARKLQPFCSDCGSTDDLQADHSPEAWQRHDEGKAIRLQDVDVVCRDCNVARGQARPGPGGEGFTDRWRRAAPVAHETITDLKYPGREGSEASARRTKESS